MEDETPRETRTFADSTEETSPRWTLYFGYALFFISGASALVYELSWSRQFGLLFGHTVYSAGIVLASIFVGLSLGLLVGGRWASRASSPLMGYAYAEFAAAGWACLVPRLLDLSESAVVLSWLSSDSFLLQLSSRAAFVFLILLPGTTALGVTLPMMAEFVSGEGDNGLPEAAGSRVSMAYAWNTTGAVVGVLFGTFFLLVTVGVRASSYLAAVGSCLSALGASFLWGFRSRNSRAADRPSSDPKPEVSVRSASTEGTVLGWTTLAALSGFGTLALEVLYTRLFSLVFHNSTYSFGLVVLGFLSALALGAAVAARLQKRFASTTLAGWAAGLGSLAVMASVVLFVALTGLSYFSFGESFSAYVFGATCLVLVVVLPPVASLGFLLPCAWEGARQGDAVGLVVGNLTAMNTTAAAAGALIASFLLLPVAGLWLSFACVAAVFALVPLLLLWAKRRRLTACGYGTLVVVLVIAVGSSPTDLFSTRPTHDEQLVRRWESAYGWIDVVRAESTGSYRVRQNLHYRFGETKDNAREYRQAHLPLLLHAQPREVLFLGLGTGLTAGGAIPHQSVWRVVAVELIPEVVEAARYLSKYNYEVVEHPKAKIRVDDARHYLMGSRKKFDVIVSDLFVPWESETGYLYTVEHYRTAKSRLEKGGLFCQGLPLYQLSRREFEIIADSFASVFPVTTLWWGGVDPAKPVVALVGTEGSLTLDATKLETRQASLRQRTGSSDYLLRSTRDFVQAYQGRWSIRNSPRLNTDEHPWIEFLAPVANRNRRGLHGRLLQEFYEEELSSLPRNSLQLKSIEGGDLETMLKDGSAWRHFLLFGE